MRLLRCLGARARHGHSGIDEHGEISSGMARWSKQYANLPERYMLRKSRWLLYKGPPNPAFKQGFELTKIPDFDLERPWTNQYWRKNQKNLSRVPHGVYAEPIRDEDWMWFRGDRVEIVRGKDKGKQGYINYIVQERNWVCVEGLNCDYETIGEEEGFPGMLLMTEKPLTVTTDIKLVDPQDELPTEVEWRFTEAGERVRVSARTGKILPIPTEAFSTIDYKTPQSYLENEHKDTKAKHVEKVTYEPRLATFEMDLMRIYGIQEDRIPKKTYWY